MGNTKRFYEWRKDHQLLLSVSTYYGMFRLITCSRLLYECVKGDSAIIALVRGEDVFDDIWNLIYRRTLTTDFNQIISTGIRKTIEQSEETL